MGDLRSFLCVLDKAIYYIEYLSIRSVSALFAHS